MLTPESIQQYQSQSLTRAGFCCHCTRPLNEAETYCCEECERELVVYRDPNGYLAGEENGES